MTFDDFIDEWRGESEYITVNTSGSTGKPKTIKLKKEFVCAGARRTNFFFHISDKSRLHSCVAADFIGGKMMAVRSELAGCRFTWETPSNTPLSGLGSNEVIDLLAVVPSQMLHIVTHLSEMPKIGAVIVGGSAIHPSLKEKIVASGLNAYETYGMTETASHIALRKIDGESTLFYPLPGITVSLDERGCLVITYNTGERIVTNDIATVAGDGGFKIMGRHDNVIITGGKKVNPEDIERRIAVVVNRLLPFGSGDFLITSRPDEKWGERVVLLIERAHNPSENSLELESRLTGELRNDLREVLLPFEMPKEIEWVDKLARTPNGKILRRNR